MRENDKIRCSLPPPSKVSGNGRHGSRCMRRPEKAGEVRFSYRKQAARVGRHIRKAAWPAKGFRREHLAGNGRAIHHHADGARCWLQAAGRSFLPHPALCAMQPAMKGQFALNYRPWPKSGQMHNDIIAPSRERVKPMPTAMDKGAASPAARAAGTGMARRLTLGGAAPIMKEGLLAEQLAVCGPEGKQHPAPWDGHAGRRHRCPVACRGGHFHFVLRRGRRLRSVARPALGKR